MQNDRTPWWATHSGPDPLEFAETLTSTATEVEDSLKKKPSLGFLRRALGGYARGPGIITRAPKRVKRQTMLVS